MQKKLKSEQIEKTLKEEAIITINSLKGNNFSDGLLGIVYSKFLLRKLAGSLNERLGSEYVAGESGLTKLCEKISQDFYDASDGEKMEKFLRKLSTDEY